MKLTPTLVEQIRQQYPAFTRTVGGLPAAFFDGPGGTQVPQCVIDAVSHYLGHTNSNHGGLFATSIESDAILDQAHRAMADFLGTDDPGTIVFGPNMTSLAMALGRSLGRTWTRGDEIIVTRLDHDANVASWLLAAEDAGATVRFVDIDPTDCTLNLEQLREQINPATKWVAVGCASNVSGSLNPISEISNWAHEVGALVFADAVHLAPHLLLDVEQLGCDFLACSPYKFFGPHLGVLWGRRELLESLPVYKVRPAVNTLPDRWMTGTQSHENIAGALAAVNYLADLGRLVSDDSTLPRRSALREAFVAIAEYESALTLGFLEQIDQLRQYHIWGIQDRDRLSQRLPTISFTHNSMSPDELTANLAERGLFLWQGNHYASELCEALGQPEGAVRAGIVHYNTLDEVNRLAAALRELA